MKRVKWILLSLFITVVVAGAVGVFAYNNGKEAGITEGLAMRNNFLQQRAGATGGAVAAAGASATGAQAQGAGAAQGGQGQAAAGANQPGAATAGQGQGAAAQGQARAARAGAAADLTAGQVKSVDGNTVEVTTQADVVKVKLTDQTQIQKTVSGATSDIKPGERIVVQGSKGADGAVDARSIQLGQTGMFGAPGSGGQ